MKTKATLLLALCLLAAGCKTYNVSPGATLNINNPPAPYPASYLVTDSGGAVIYAAPAQTGWYGSTYCWNPWGNNDSTTTYKYVNQGSQNCRQRQPSAGHQPPHKQQAQQGSNHKPRKAHDI